MCLVGCWALINRPVVLHTNTTTTTTTAVIIIITEMHYLLLVLSVVYFSGKTYDIKQHTVPVLHYYIMLAFMAIWLVGWCLLPRSQLDSCAECCPTVGAILQADSEADFFCKKIPMNIRSIFHCSNGEYSFYITGRQLPHVPCEAKKLHHFIFAIA